VSKLVDRISELYVHLLMRYIKPDKDEFFHVYCEFIAQCTHSAFTACFPSSRGLHDRAFQQEVCDIVFHMLSGIHPSVFPQWTKIQPVNKAEDGELGSRAGILG
jgi:Protein of unknown function